jgi:hypothetical protein
VRIEATKKSRRRAEATDKRKQPQMYGRLKNVNLYNISGPELPLDHIF